MSFDSLLRKSSDVVSFNRHEAYFDGKRRLDALGVSLPPEMRVLELVADWPRIVVEALEERLTVDGFTISGERADERYMRRWLANAMDIQSSLVHTESLVQGVGYVVVGPGEGWAKITAHSSLGFKVNKDRATGVVKEALQLYKDAEGNAAVHYESGTNTLYRHVNGAWKRHETKDSGTSRIPVVPFLNRARIRDDFGRSEMADVMRYTDAASRSITNLQVATELVALPQRYMLGAKPDDFKDKDGNTVPQWQTYVGRILTGPKDGHVGSLPGADLQQIISTVRMYAGFVAASSGLSLMSLGIASEANPASADALNAVDNRHVRRAEKKQTLFGSAWKDVQLLADEIEGVGESDTDRLETHWRPAATMTLGAVSAGAQALVTAGIIPPVVARDMIGLSSEQKRIAADADDNSTASLLRAVGA